MVRPIVIGLLRRWSVAQNDDSFRKTVQIDVLEDKCKGLGYQTKLYDEGQVSGQRLEKRAKAQELFADLQAGKIQGLGALDIKRLTRDRIGIERATIKQILIDTKAIFVTRDKVYDFRNANDNLLYDVLGMLSGLEISTIRDTFWDGNVKRRIAGLPSSCSQAPVGYKHVIVGEVRANGTVARQMVKDPEHDAVVQRFWQVASTAPSYTFIRNTLNQEGTLRPPTKRCPTPAAWALPHVIRTIQNPCYSGILVVGRHGRSTVWDLHPLTRSDTVERELTEHGGVFEREVPEWCYVAPEEQRRIIARMEANDGAAKNGGRRGVNSENPLGHVVRCLHCGGPMNFVKKWMKTKDGTTTHRVYHCRTAMLHTNTCRGQMLSAPRALDAVFRHIQQLASDPAFLERWGVGGSLAKGRTPNDSLATARGTLHILEVKYRKLLDRELTAESEEETSALKDIRKETEASIRETKQNIAGLEELTNNQDMVERVLQLQRDFAARALRRPWYVQQQLVASFLAEVRIDGTGYGKARKLHVVAYRLAGSEELITGGISDHTSSCLYATMTSRILNVLAALSAGTGEEFVKENRAGTTGRAGTLSPAGAGKYRGVPTGVARYLG